MVDFQQVLASRVRVSIPKTAGRRYLRTDKSTVDGRFSASLGEPRPIKRRRNSYPPPAPSLNRTHSGSHGSGGAESIGERHDAIDGVSVFSPLHGWDRAVPRSRHLTARGNAVLHPPLALRGVEFDRPILPATIDRSVALFLQVSAAANRASLCRCRLANPAPRVRPVEPPR